MGSQLMRVQLMRVIPYDRTRGRVAQITRGARPAGRIPQGLSYTILTPTHIIRPFARCQFSHPSTDDPHLTLLDNPQGSRASLTSQKHGRRKGLKGHPREGILGPTLEILTWVRHTHSVHIRFVYRLGIEDRILVFAES